MNVLFIKTEKTLIQLEVRERILNTGYIKNVVSNDTDCLRFKLSELNTLLKWENSKEFEYKGIMYDVISTKIEGDSIIYYCYRDIKETINKQKFIDLISFLSGNSNQKTIVLKTGKYFRMLYLPIDYPVFGLVLNLLKKNFISIAVLHDLNFLIPPTPPPK